MSCMFSEAPFVVYIMLLLDHSSFSMMILDLLLLYSIMYEKNSRACTQGKKVSVWITCMVVCCTMYSFPPSASIQSRALYNVLQSQLPLLGWPAPDQNIQQNLHYLFCMLRRNWMVHVHGGMMPEHTTPNIISCIALPFSWICYPHVAYTSLLPPPPQNFSEAALYSLWLYTMVRLTCRLQWLEAWMKRNSLRDCFLVYDCLVYSEWFVIRGEEKKHLESMDCFLQRWHT
jgi:hypothetical protein